MHSPSRRPMATVSTLTLLASLLLARPAAAAPAPGTAPGTAPGAARELLASAAAQKAAGWLSLQFTAGTHLQSLFGATHYDDQGLTADGILALDSAGIGQGYAKVATTWLSAHVNDYVGDGVGASYAGALAKSALTAQAQGLNPASFGGRNLLAALAARQQGASGAKPGRFSDKSASDFSSAISQSLAIIVERRARITGPALTSANSSLLSLQCADHGFRLDYPTATTNTCSSDVDATAYAVQALAGSTATTAVSAALDFLAAQQGVDGGLKGTGTGTENANSTGLAVVAFALGGRSTNATRGYGYLLARQQPDTAAVTSIGAVNFSAGLFDASTAVRASTQGILGLVAGAPGGTAADAGLLTVSSTGDATGAATTAQPSGIYRSIAAARLLDTRTAVPVGPGKSVTLAIAGRAGIPAGISAAAVTITAVLPTGPGWVVAYPSGTPRPTGSSLNLTTGVTVAASVQVQVGTDGRIVLHNGGRSPLNLIVDVGGYFLGSNGQAPGTLRSLAPTRLLDTRTTTAIPAGGTVSVDVTRPIDVNAYKLISAVDVAAAAITVTAVGAGAPGHVVAYATGTAAPNTSTLNVSAGQTIANNAVVRVGLGGKVSLVNATSKPLNLLLDVTGFYLSGTATFGGTFVPLNPTRVFDTRGHPPVAANTARAVPVAGQGGVPATGAGALAYNLTAVTPAAPGYVVTYPGGAARPLTSNINLNPNRTVANQSVTGLSPQGSFNLYNASPQPVNLVVDVSGYYRS